MITCKDLHGTAVYEQLRAYINIKFKDLPKGNKAWQLGMLSRAFVKNFNNNREGDASLIFEEKYKKRGFGVASAFVWADTPEGHYFWAEVAWPKVEKVVENKPPAPKAPDPIPKKAPGWW